MKTPYQILIQLWLVASSLVLCGAGKADDDLLASLPSSLSLTSVGGCKARESWGTSIYLLDGERGIGHYARYSGEHYPIRFIATDQRVTLCAVLGDALVFVDPAHGIYQTDRSIEADGEQLWIAPTPLHYGQDSRFEIVDEALFLVSGALRDPVLIDVAVRNDHVPELQPNSELAWPGKLGAPIPISEEQMLVPGVSQNHVLDASSLTLRILTEPRQSSSRFESDITHIAATLLPGLLSIELSGEQRQQTGEESTSQPLEISTDTDVSGLCMGFGHVGSGGNGLSELATFDRDGEVRRFHLGKDDISYTGKFKLTGEALDCLIDDLLERLYVIERDVGIWVFDLRENGLEMPRAVTTDKMIESLSGLALYDGDAAYLITQSLGDGTFLVFDRHEMQLVGWFRVGPNLAAGVDGVRASRGFAASALTSQTYPEGWLLVQDQRNRLPEAEENLKVIDWRLIKALLEKQEVTP